MQMGMNVFFSFAFSPSRYNDNIISMHYWKNKKNKKAMHDMHNIKEKRITDHPNQIVYHLNGKSHR